MIAQRLLRLAGIVAVATATATPSHAQYFGQNKVRYEHFDFKVLSTRHFDVHYYPEFRAAADDAARLAEDWYDRLSTALGHELSGRQALILYASPSHFQQTNVTPERIGEGTGGFTDFAKRRIVLPVAGPLAETDHVIAHELVHAFQFDITGVRGPIVGSGPTAARLPLWFMEGMAEYLTLGAEDPHTTMFVRDAAAHDRLPNFGQLSDPRWFPYRFGHAFWAYLAGRHGNKVVGEALRLAGRRGDARAALEQATGTNADSLIAGWHRATKAWSAPVVAATQPASGQARALLHGRPSRYSLAPALSPDGSRVAFFSERSLFSVELYLADVASGRIERTLTRTNVDPHLTGIQFIHSAGSFSADGRRIVYTGLVRGRPVLRVADAADGRVERELEFTSLGEILDPSFSPDARQVVFSALEGGFVDLWVVDLASGERRRLTQDAYAEVMPAWSPDGRTIAYATDRWSDTWRSSGEADYRLALIDAAGGEPRRVPGFERGKHLDPQWSRDGASLFFVADPHGVSDVYRVTLADGTLRQVTRLRGGTSGIGWLSPSISLAAAADRLAFTAFEDGRHVLFLLDGEAALAGTAPAAAFTTDAARLPGGGADAVAGAVPPAPGAGARPVVSPGRARRDSLSLGASRDYRARLGLDYVAQPSLGVAGGSNGVGFSGGAGLYWSDLLGDHQLATALQFSNIGGDFLNNLAGGVGYTNQQSRWNWGGQVSQVPYVSSQFFIGDTIVDGRQIVIEQELRSWEIHRDVAGFVSYPFSRFQRVELGAGFRHIGFLDEAQERVYDAFTGEVLFDDTFELGRPAGLDLGTGGAALVYDNAQFGGTSPLLGQRMRLELGTVIGTLQFQEALADLRRYQPLFRPLVLAGRIVHTGRYGADGEDSRLGSLFVGYPSLVRGYDEPSFSAGECEDPDCRVFTQLFGSKLAVANVELRLPMLGPLGLIPSEGVPPIEFAGFWDAGVAWTREDEASFLGGSRDPVTSYGGAVRVNLFGFAIGEVAYVHPDDRPRKGWHWVFSLKPGF